MRFAIRFTVEAEADLDRLTDFLLDRAQTAEDFDDALDALREIRVTITGLIGTSPFSFRKTGRNPMRRELIIPFRRSGYVAKYEIEDGQVIVLAVRQQLEEDDH